MKVEHDGKTYTVTIIHHRPPHGIGHFAARRGLTWMKAITDCDIHCGDLWIARGGAYCVEGDQFEYRLASELAFRRAVTEIPDRALRGALLQAYYSRRKASGKVREFEVKHKSGVVQRVVHVRCAT